jgi:hypothetical protein
MVMRRVIGSILIRAHYRGGEQRTGVPAGHGGVPSGQREPRRSRGTIWAAIMRQRITSPRRNSPGPPRGPDDAEPAAADIPAVDADVDSRQLIAAQLPQVLVMHDASDSSQMGPCSREPSRGNQDLGRVRTLTTTA